MLFSSCLYVCVHIMTQARLLVSTCRMACITSAVLSTAASPGPLLSLLRLSALLLVR